MHTELDDVFYAEYDYESAPNVATAETADLFKPKTATGDAVYEDEWGGTGAWEEHDVDESRILTTVSVDNTKTINIVNFKKTIPIPVEYYEDSKFDFVNNIIKDAGLRARTTRDENAMAVYVGGFGTTTTADAAYLFSDAHTTVNGDTVDNLETGVLNATNFYTLYQSLIEQKGVDGEPGSQVPVAVLVPPALWATATEVLESELKSGITDNDINWIKVISNNYAITLYQSVFVGAAYATALNSDADTSYYLVSRNHSIGRYVRVPVTTDLVEYRYDDQDRYKFKGRFREECDAVSYTGVAASNGTV